MGYCDRSGEPQKVVAGEVAPRCRAVSRCSAGQFTATPLELAIFLRDVPMAARSPRAGST